MCVSQKISVVSKVVSICKVGIDQESEIGWWVVIIEIAQNHSIVIMWNKVNMWLVITQDKIGEAVQNTEAKLVGTD